MSMSLNLVLPWRAVAFILMTACWIGLMPGPGPGDAAAAECRATAVVKQAVASLQAAAENGSPAAFTSAVRQHASVTGLALFALGRYRNALSGGDRTEYVRLTAGYVGRVIAKYRKRLLGHSLTIVGCIPQGRATLVRSHFGHSAVVWRVQGHLISDIKLDGIWLAIRLRHEFVRILRHRHGDVAALISYLRTS